MMGDLRHISLFSGVESASYAWEGLGSSLLATSEIDPYCVAVLSRRFPDTPNLGDVTRVDWSDYRGKADIVVAGSPCQSFSVAGNRSGLKGVSGLVLHLIDAISEIRPQAFVWENVPGVLTSGDGQDFRRILQELDGIGFDVAWRVLDAQFFGLAQRRRRLYLVGMPRGSGRDPIEVLFDGEPGGLDREPVQTKRARLSRDKGRGDGFLSRLLEVSGNIIGRSPTSGGNQLGVVDPDRSGAFTLTATDRHAVIIGDGDEMVTRRLTPVECERLQGLPDGWTDIEGWRYGGKSIYKVAHALSCSCDDMDETLERSFDYQAKCLLDGWCLSERAGVCDSNRYRVIGNAMPVPVMRWIGQRLIKVLRD